MNADSDSKVTIPKYIWVALGVAVLLITGSMWLAASFGNGADDLDVARKPDIPAGLRSMGPPHSYAPNPPAHIDPAPAADRSTPSRVVVRVTPVEKPPVPNLPAKPAGKQVATDSTPKDMFPVGNVAKEQPKVAQADQKTPEAFPSFEYEGKVWEATGRFVSYDEADIVPTGHRTEGGQWLYALVDSTAPEDVLFVQSADDPAKFAVYRAS